MSSNRLNAHIHNFTKRMFIETADHNYALSRYALQNEFSLDSLWLANQAIEKYLKAILLLNGYSVKRYGHNIEKLYDKCSEVLGGFDLNKWETLGHISEADWISESAENFLKRLYSCGNPENRYFTYSYSVIRGDLCKLDILVWIIRRYCRPLEEKTTEDKIVNWSELLPKNPKMWKLGGNMLIEKSLQSRTSPSISNALLKDNFAFNEDNFQGFSQYGGCANAPFYMLFQQIGTKNPNSNQEVIDVIEWAIASIKLSSEDLKALERKKEEIKTIQNSRPPAEETK